MQKPHDRLPLYGLPPGADCCRSLGPWHTSVSTQTGSWCTATTVWESAKAGLDHRRGAHRLRVLTYAPAESVTSGAVLRSELSGYRLADQPGPHLPPRRGTRAIPVDGTPLAFAGHELPGLTVLLARLTDYAIAVISRTWPLADTQLVLITDLAPYRG